MNLQKLVSSEAIYQKLKDKTIETIKNDPQKQNVLRNVVLFCKQVFSSNTNQRKKYLCLLVNRNLSQLIKDIFENISLEYYEKLVDQYLAIKLFQMVQSYLEAKNKEVKMGNEQRQNFEKVYNFAVETIVFWAKRLSSLQKSAFFQVYQQLKKMKIELPQQFLHYKREMLVQLWKSQQNQTLPKQNTNPIIIQLDVKFKKCKDDLQYCINQSVLNDEEVNTKGIIQSLRDFLLFFFSNYRELEGEQTSQRDIIIVYFHILNNLYKRICNQLHISVQEIISTTKEIFEAVYPSDYDSVDRMDMIELAGVFKYNALTVFQRIHQRIEKEDAILGPFKLNINLEQNQRPPLPSGMQDSISLSRAGSAQRFTRNNMSGNI